MKPQRIPLADAMQQWLTEEIEPNNRDSTLKLYRLAAGELVAQGGISYTDEVTVDLILQLRAAWLRRGLKRSTINAYRTFLNIWLAYCVLRGWIEENPVSKVKALKKKSTDEEPTLPLDPDGGDQNWQLVHRSIVPFLARRRAGRGIQQHPEHFLALIELLYHTGLRISDALFFDPRRIVDTPHGSSYTTRQIKNGQEVTVFLERWLAEKLRSLEPLGKHLFFEGATDWAYYINCNIRNPLAALGRELSFSTSLRPHRFRDSFAVNSLNQGVAISDLKDLLGHKSIATTEKYYLPFVRSRQMALEKRLYSAKSGLHLVPISA